jgi:hypothetical protein
VVKEGNQMSDMNGRVALITGTILTPDGGFTLTV